MNKTRYRHLDAANTEICRGVVLIFWMRNVILLWTSEFSVHLHFLGELSEKRASERETEVFYLKKPIFNSVGRR
jgi:hypothetical protein